MSISRSTGQGRHGGAGKHRSALIVESLFEFRFDQFRRAGALEPGANNTWVRHIDSDEWLGPDIIIFNAHDGHCEVLTAEGSQRIDYRTRKVGYGQRTFFSCPRCHRAMGVLLMPPSGRVGCRKCIGANYASTGEKQHERAGRRAMTIRNRQIALGGVPDREDEEECVFPSRPKWQRFKVFNRLAAEFEQLMEIHIRPDLEYLHERGYGPQLGPLPPKPPKMRFKRPGVWKARQPPRLTEEERIAAEDARMARNRASIIAEREQPQASFEITKADYAARREPVHWSILDWAKENGLTC